MTDRASKAYACVAFRIMIYEGTDMTEENFAILIEDLYDFYTAKEMPSTSPAWGPPDRRTAGLAGRRPPSAAPPPRP